MPLKDGFYFQEVKLNEVNNIDWRIGISQLKDKSVDLVVTDPPYGMSFKSNHRKVKHKEIKDDDNLDWLDNWISELRRVCKDDAHLYIFISWHNVDIFKIALSEYFNVKNILVWEKNNTGMGDLEGDWAPKHELILFCSNGKKKLNGNRLPNIIRCERTANDDHPTEKPVQIMQLFVEKSSQKGDIVLDTFSGSFPTLKACRRTGRIGICFEIEKEYCDIAEPKIKSIQESAF